ncbi:hypothetical protein [Crossiella sp. NPDC003009]
MIKQTVALLAAAGAMLGGTATAMADEDMPKHDHTPASQFWKNDDSAIELLNNTNIQLPVCVDDNEIGLVPVDALNKKYSDGPCVEAEMENASEN